ncbi:MAG: serine protease [Planctomycetes bacterium]|nr:serine protease [Planctomycetota bacterium]MCB9825640.1 serine protease [Planctomycetota bacterium]MCB9829777.1 serine protease [Planctomycetota bacterium]
MLGTGVSPSGPAFVSRQGSARVLLVALLLAPLVPCVASAGDPVVPVPAPPADARSEADTLRAAADALRPSLVHLTWVPAARPEAGERRVGLVLGPGGHIVAAGPTAFEPGRWIARRDDGHSAEARVLGRDPETFLTVLASPWASLPAASDDRFPEGGAAEGGADPRGRAVALVGADDVLALGAVRATERHLVVEVPGVGTSTSTGLLEAALAVLPEDVGAPWVDADGHVLALTVAASSTPAEAPARPQPGPALGVPIGRARLVASLIERYGSVPRAVLGVWTRPADSALRAHLGVQGGHLVVRMEPGGAAAKAGLQVHDLLVGLGGRALPEPTSLGDVLLEFRPGQRVNVRIVRQGEILERELELAPR